LEETAKPGRRKRRRQEGGFGKIRSEEIEDAQNPKRQECEGREGESSQQNIEKV